MIKKRISFPKGDTKPFKIRIKMADGTYFVPNANSDNLVFEVRATPSSNAVIKKEFANGDIVFDEGSNFFLFTVTPDDTEVLCAEYLYLFTVKFTSTPTDTVRTVAQGVFEVH